MNEKGQQADKLTLAEPKWMQQLSPKGNVATSGATAERERERGKAAEGSGERVRQLQRVLRNLFSIFGATFETIL